MMEFFNFTEFGSYIIENYPYIGWPIIILLCLVAILAIVGFIVLLFWIIRTICYAVEGLIGMIFFGY